MKQLPTLLEMLEAGVHFGHRKSRWHPKMKPFIFTERNGVHIIDLEKTQEYLQKTLETVAKMAEEGKVILFATTKPHARDIVKEAAISCGMPYLVDRWIGGLLTNYDEIKKLIKAYNTLKQKYEQGEFEHYTKKEQLQIEKELEKKDKTLSGLANLEKMPDALFIPTMQREKTAVTEALRMNVPVIGVCDTNVNPEKATYVIPANDDAVNSITMMVEYVADAINAGKEKQSKQGKE